MTEIDGIERTSYPAYQFIVNDEHPFPYRIDEGFPIPHGEFVMLAVDDLNNLLDDAAKMGERDNG